MLSGERLLIVEEEFLIALDIQRVLEDAGAATVVIARNYKELAALEARFAEFALAIVTPPKPGTPETMLLERLARSGPALVICSATSVRPTEGVMAAAELVYKPFSDDELLDACKRARLARKPV